MSVKFLTWQDGVGSRTFELDVDVEQRRYTISQVSQLIAILVGADVSEC